MLSFEQMLLRLVIALALGAILGIERELAGKEAGVRTEMLVAGGAAVFAMIGLVLPYIVSANGAANLATVIERNSGFLTVIANIVVGIGFLGAGLIIKTGDRPHGLTTAALVWMTAAIGILAGIGLTEFAVVATLLIAFLVYLLRKANISEKLEQSAENGR